MPDFTIETTYHLPIFRHRSYSAKTPEAACRAAIDDDDWENSKTDYDSSGPIHVSGVWEGADAAYSGPPIPVPSQFGGVSQRKAGHLEILLGVLKMLFNDIQSDRPTSADWLRKASWAIARGEAILAGARDPDEPLALPKAPHVIAVLREERVRDQIISILQTDTDFGDLTSDAVTDDGVHGACLTIAAKIDLSHEIGVAEFRAALVTLGEAGRARSE